MGRFSAPRFDHDNEDDGQAMAMDWTITPDDEHAGDLNGDRRHGGHGNGDSRSLVCYNTASGTNDQDHDADDSNNFSRGESGHRAGNSNHSTHHENRLQNPTNANVDNNNCEAFLQVAEQYLEQSNHYLEQQYLSEKRRRRIRTVMIIAVAIIAIVLKRHAPPPPPLWNQSPLAKASFSTDLDSMVTDTGRLSTEPSVSESTPGMSGITQHETWASYSRHLLYLVHHALAYGLSVAWYAISNAFFYAMEEVRDGSTAVLYENGDNNDESLWMNWKKKLISISTSLSQLQTAKESQHNSQAMADIQHRDDGTLNKISSCPIRLPAANNLWTHLPRGATTHDTTNTASIIEGWSTEEFLRQTIGTSLAPQNLALKIIAEGIDVWGDSLVEEAPVALVHKIATALSASPKDRYIDDETLSDWILPPSTGFLLVGPEGVGKLHAARRIAHLFLGHCSELSSVSSGISTPIQELEGVLEVIAGDYNHDGHEVHPAKELIVNHIRSRRGLGSVIIIHHIELLPTPILSEISQVLRGKTDTLSYQMPEQLVEASCDGTVFVLTSKQWGTKSIFQHIQINGGLNGLRRESLVSSIRWEVDSHLDYWTKLASHTKTVAPFLPFEQEDLSSILQSRVQTLNRKYQGLHWNRLEVSHATIKYSIGVEHAEYLDLYNAEEEESVVALLTFSASGAHTLDNNALWQTLRTRLVTGTRRRPGLTLKVDLDDNSKEIVFRWCNRENGGLESCEEEWRSLLT